MNRRLLENIKSPMTYSDFTALPVNSDIEVILCAPSLGTSGHFISYADGATGMTGFTSNVETGRGVCKEFMTKHGLGQLDQTHVFHLVKTGTNTCRLYRQNAWGLAYQIVAIEECLLQTKDTANGTMRFVGGNGATLLTTTDISEAISNNLYHWEILVTGTNISFQNNYGGSFFYWAQAGSSGSFSLRAGAANGSTWTVSGNDIAGFKIQGSKGNACITNNQTATVSKTADAQWWVWKLDNIQPNLNTTTNDTTIWDNNPLNLTVVADLQGTDGVLVEHHNDEMMFEFRSGTRYFNHETGYSPELGGDCGWCVFRI